MQICRPGRLHGDHSRLLLQNSRSSPVTSRGSRHLIAFILHFDLQRTSGEIRRTLSAMPQYSGRPGNSAEKFSATVVPCATLPNLYPSAKKNCEPSDWSLEDDLTKINKFSLNLLALKAFASGIVAMFALLYAAISEGLHCDGGDQLQ